MVKASIKSICKLISSGGTPSRKRSDYFSYIQGHLWVKSKELLDCGIEDTEEYISQEGLKNSSAKYYPANTVLIAMYGANVGQLGWLKRPATVNQAICGLIIDEEKADWRFVYYSLLMNRGDLTVQARGAAQQNLNQDLVRQFEIELPPLPVQYRIASILSTYDDLIENCQRRIKILESMARALYREWFVVFRFPGHEAHPRTSSPLGEIPEGWEVKKVGAISSFINRGLAPSYDDEGPSVVINQKCIRDQRISLEPARRQSKVIPKEKLIRYGDVLINSTGVGTLGRVAQVYEILEQCTVDTHVTIARPGLDVDIDFYGCCLLALEETFERLGVGATGQTELNRTSISNIDLALPPKQLQGRFGSSVRSIRAQIAVLSNQIRNLRRTRDFLLPRLMSGQLDVSNLSMELVAGAYA